MVVSDLTAPLVTAVPALVVVVTAELTGDAGPVLTAELARLLHRQVEVELPLLGLGVSAGRAVGAGGEIPGMET